MPITATNPFKGRQHPGDVILQAVRWYLRYPLAYEHVAELLAERGLEVDASCIWRWVQTYSPELNKRCRLHLKRTNKTYRVDETYIKVKSGLTPRDLSTCLRDGRCFPYNPVMALVVFLRGVNVGGHRTFRPSILARELSDHGVVNVGAAGTFVVRKPGPQAEFRTVLLSKLPFEAEVMLCDGRDLISLEMDHPFGSEPSCPDIVRFVSILSKADRALASVPCNLPGCGEWFVRLIASKNRFIFGEYRRHMKTIGYLGQIDKLFGGPATTRNWNTIIAVVRILKSQSRQGKRDLTDICSPQPG